MKMLWNVDFSFPLPIILESSDSVTRNIVESAVIARRNILESAVNVTGNILESAVSVARKIFESAVTVTSPSIGFTHTNREDKQQAQSVLW